MTDNQTPPPIGSRQTDQWLNPGPQNAMAVYILYLAGFVVGITPIIGIVFAHINRGKAGGFVESHYTWQIRTFWIALLAWVVCIVLIFLLIGIPLMIAVAVWFVVRVVKGMIALNRNEPIPDPMSWWI